MDEQPRRNLVATLGFLQLEPREPELRMLHGAFDHGRGIGVFAVALHRVGHDLSLIRQADRGWNTTFYITGRMHSIVGGWANDPNRGTLSNTPPGKPCSTSRGSCDAKTPQP